MKNRQRLKNLKKKYNIVRLGQEEIWIQSKPYTILEYLPKHLEHLNYE